MVNFPPVYKTLIFVVDFRDILANYASSDVIVLSEVLEDVKNPNYTISGLYTWNGSSEETSLSSLKIMNILKFSSHLMVKRGRRREREKGKRRGVVKQLK
jgi:hypothetical protein